MKLYEIDEALYNLIDKETGEIKDYEEFQKLEMDRDKKIENTCLWIKDLKGDAEKINAEIKGLQARKKMCDNLVKRLKGYVEYSLKGDKFKTPKVSVSYRKTERVMVDDDFIEWAKENADDLLTYKEPTASLTAIKEAINNGREIEHAEIQENTSMCIK